MGLITWYFLFNLDEKELRYLLYFTVMIMLPATIIIGIFSFGTFSGELTFYCTIAVIMLSIMIAIVWFFKKSR